MGYRQIGIDKNGKKKYEVTIELGKDILGNRQRMKKRKSGTIAEIKLFEAELTKKYYHKGEMANIKELTFSQYSQVFLKKHCEGNIGLVTINNYKRLLKGILPIIGNFKLAKRKYRTLNDRVTSLSFFIC